MAAPPPTGSTSSMPEPSLPKRRNTSDGASTALRNSCETCASSKVKCSGRKPVCHRCEKRGFQCEYFHAKRAGRKPAGSANTASSSSSGRASQPSNQAEATQENAVGAETAYASPRGTVTELSDIWGDLNPLDRSLFSDLSNITETSSGFTPTFPMMQLPAIDAAAPTAPMASSNDLYSSTTDSDINLNLGSLSGNESVADLFTFPLSTPGATALATPITSGSSSLERSPSRTKSCSCLVQALGLLRRLSELMSSTDAAWATQRDADAVRIIEDILQQNKAGIDTATGMLSCSGRHDGYLLIIICLTAFKTIELLRAVLPEAPSSSTAQVSPSRRLSVPSSAESDVRGGDWARHSTQAMLSEFHSVRGLSKVLSEKLRIQTTATAPSSSGYSGTTATTPDGVVGLSPSSKDALMSEVEVTRLPFSAEVYRQLEIDLNSRVKALSQQMIRRLRYF